MYDGSRQLESRLAKNPYQAVNLHELRREESRRGPYRLRIGHPMRPWIFPTQVRESSVDVGDCMEHVTTTTTALLHRL